MRLSLMGRLYGFPTLKGEMQMYSPKIKEDLIPTIYRLSKEKKAPMTKVVDGILRSALNDLRSPSKKNPSYMPVLLKKRRRALVI